MNSKIFDVNIIETGDLVQITNPKNDWFGVILIVSEVKSFGIQGYATIPLKGNTYYRANFGEIEKVGFAAIAEIEPDEAA